MLFWNAVVKKSWILACVTSCVGSEEFGKQIFLTRTVRVKLWIWTCEFILRTFRWCSCRVWERWRIWVCMPSSVSAVEGAIAKRKKNEPRPNSCATTSGGCQRKNSAFYFACVCLCVCVCAPSKCQCVLVFGWACFVFGVRKVAK